MKYFYLNQEKQQLGPCTLEELQALAQSGQIPFNTLIAQPGAAEWVELSSLIQSPPETCSIHVTQASNIPSYLAAAIIVTILCCIPFGIVAIVSACKVDKYIAVGDLRSAEAASKNAKKWIIISIVSGVVLGILLSVLN